MITLQVPVWRQLLPLLSLPPLIWGLAGCRHTAPPRQDAVMLSVPFFPDDGELCGPVSLAAVLHYWDRPVPLSSITEAIYSEQAGGTLPHDLLWFARQQGLQGERRTGNLEQIRKSIDQGVPLILLVGTGNSRFPANHLLVVTGYDSDAVYVHSATFRNLRLPNHNLQALWKPHDNWMLLIAPSDQSLPPA